jgi:hypothetical protein
MVLNKNGEQLSDLVEFNPEFIRANKIKSINGRFTYKKTGSVMRETNFWHVFTFDTLGRIVQSYETRKDDGTRDTIWNNYFYNDRGFLIYQSIGSKDNYEYTTTVYNSEGRVTSIEKFQRHKDLYGIPVIKEGQVDLFSFEEKDGHIIKTKRNKQGTPYAEITIFYNENGQLIKEEERYIATNEGLIYYFDYDNMGNLLQKQTRSSNQSIVKEATTFKYDTRGEIMEKKVFNETVLKSETQYIHTESTGFISAILYQEGGSSTIRMLRIKEYEYY